LKITDELDPEKILHVYDPAVGMKAVVVVDTTSAGGTRMLPDITTEEAVPPFDGLLKLAKERLQI